VRFNTIFDHLVVAYFLGYPVESVDRIRQWWNGKSLLPKRPTENQLCIKS